MTSVESIQAILNRWGNSFGGSAEIPLLRIGLQYAGDNGKAAHSVVLYEQAASELSHLLDLDSRARLGHLPAPTDLMDLLVHAALRLRHLENQRGHNAEPEHPRLQARIAGTLRQLLQAAEALLTEHDAPSSLGPSITALSDRERAALPAAPYNLPGRESPTLADQFLLTVLPGRYTSTVHVRIYRPADRPPVVVLGELTDYHSPGFVESPAKFFDDVRDRLPALVAEDPAWVHALPTDYVAFTQRHMSRVGAELGELRQGLIRLVVNEAPGSVKLRLLTRAELHSMADGPVRQWHAADYNAGTLTGWGVRTVDSVGGSRLRTRQTITIVFRCRRFGCDEIFARVLRAAAEARCPRCGSTKMQPVRVIGTDE
ncbi:hypothetical protein [Actinoplanes sp. RD1]|uniref:hypothetical protein n=1 Tax=Actinoplanes sp. RD1 TaxID=3064538 RepID=UPI00274146A1|nr:hypothetical protein [Actinoplanes sp. RD1]